MRQKLGRCWRSFSCTRTDSGSSNYFWTSLERLAAEMQISMKMPVLRERFRERFYITKMVPSVDAPEVNWEYAKQVEFDNTVLEELVHHPSPWLKFLAAFVLDARMSSTERFEACKRMLQDGQNETLYLAAEMAEKLPDHAGHGLILARLREPLQPGAHYLFEQLAEDEFPVEHSHSDVLELGLMSSFAEVAESAAKWCGTSANGSEAWLRRLLRQAFEHWTINEQPYPKSSVLCPMTLERTSIAYCALSTISNSTSLLNSPRIEGMMYRNLPCRIWSTSFPDLMRMMIGTGWWTNSGKAFLDSYLHQIP